MTPDQKALFTAAQVLHRRGHKELAGRLEGFVDMRGTRPPPRFSEGHLSSRGEITLRVERLALQLCHSWPEQRNYIVKRLRAIADEVETSKGD